MKTRLAALMAGIILLLGPAFASAATFEWVGYDWSVEGILEQYTPTEDWNDPLAWYSPDTDGYGVPGPSDTAIIGNFDIDGYGVVDNIVALPTDVAVSNLVVSITASLNLQNHTINLYGKLSGPYNIYNGSVNGVSTNATLSGVIVVGLNGQISGTLNVATNDTLNLQIYQAGSPSLTLNNYGTLAIQPYGGVTDVSFPNVTLNNYGTLSLQSVVNMNLSGLTFTNYGTVDWISSTINGGGYYGAFIYNYGLWDSQGDLTFNGNGGQGTYFFNYGSFRKSSGTSTNALSNVFFYSSGTVDVESGTVTLNDGGTFSGGAVTGPGGLQLLAAANGSAPFYNFNNTLTTTNVQLAGGHLDGNNTLMGGFTWSSGNLDNVGVIGTVTVATNTLLVMNSGGNQITVSGILTNAGTMQLTGGTTLSLSGYPPYGVLVNLPGGTVDMQENGTLNRATGYEYISNQGTFLKSAGGGTFNILPAFYSSGTVDVESGTVTLNYGGTFTGGAVTGPGGLLLTTGNGSTVNYSFNNTLTTTNVQLAGGTLDGNNTLMGGFTLSSGNLDSVSVVTVATNTLLVLNSGGNQLTLSAVLTNYGTVDWTSSTIGGGGYYGTFIYNYGLWDSQGDWTFNGNGGSGTYFYNKGTFRKSSGINTTALNNVSFYSSGTVDVESGTVTLNNGGSFSGGAVTGSGGLQLCNNGGSAPYYNINNTLMTTNVQLAGGALDGNNTLMGGFTWSSGYFDSVSTVTVATNTLLVLAGASQHNAQAIVTNYGTVEWTSPTISGGGYYGTFIYNYGLWDSQGDWSFNGSGGSGTYFYNIGTFRKSSGINTTALNSVAFYNSGGVEIDSGTLSVPNSITVAAGGLTIGISGTNSGQYGQLVSGGVATLNGPLNVFLANGYKSFAPDQFTILSAASDSGSFSSVSLPSGLSVNYAGAYAWLQSTNMQVIPQLSGTNLQFSFYTFTGQSYTIQTTTNLAGGIWNFYQNTTGNNDFQTFTLPITNTVPELFLRVSQP